MSEPLSEHDSDLWRHPGGWLAFSKSADGGLVVRVPAMRRAAVGGISRADERELLTKLAEHCGVELVPEGFRATRMECGPVLLVEESGKWSARMAGEEAPL